MSDAAAQTLQQPTRTITIRSVSSACSQRDCAGLAVRYACASALRTATCSPQRALSMYGCSCLGHPELPVTARSNLAVLLRAKIGRNAAIRSRTRCRTRSAIPDGQSRHCARVKVPCRRQSGQVVRPVRRSKLPAFLHPSGRENRLLARTFRRARAELLRDLGASSRQALSCGRRRCGCDSSSRQAGFLCACEQSGRKQQALLRPQSRRSRRFERSRSRHELVGRHRGRRKQSWWRVRFAPARL